jgi:phage baseplate assembly protein W
MASIVIDDLRIQQENKPVYTDIKLDLKSNYVLDPRLESKDTLIDLIASYDIDAIKNSIYNLFTTMPGQKILNPIYGLNLMQFVFKSVTDLNAKLIGDAIVEGIKKFEPRLVIKKVYIFPDYDNNTYEIGLRLAVPSLNIEAVAVKGTLSESGYYMN